MKRKTVTQPKRQASADGRRGDVFTLRLTAEERSQLQAAAEHSAPMHSYGPVRLGPWIVAAALRAALQELGGTVAPKRRKAARGRKAAPGRRGTWCR